ncbi:heterodisulfide reductase [bacterium]|nr:MAG: heterodisulfide reductase [bacterium]
MQVELGKQNTELAQKIIELSGTNVESCYQCGECSAGCPSAFEMDLLPNQINALLNMGDADRVLNSNTIWFCAACFQCESRCPHGIDIAKVCEAARQVILRGNVDRIELWREGELERVPAVALVSAGRKFTA